MNKLLLSAALAGAIAASAHAHEKPTRNQEKCYGVSKAGQNNCSSADGKHGCAGLASVNYSKFEWKLVPKGECIKLGGMLNAATRPLRAD